MLSTIFYWISDNLTIVLIKAFILFFMFEIVPYFLKYGSTIKENFEDFVLYQILGVMYSTIAFFIFKKYLLSDWPTYLSTDLRNLNLFFQVFIVYMVAEFVIYTLHYLYHTRNLVIFSGHKFHHRVREDMQWVNARKEDLVIVTLFSLVFATTFSILQISFLAQVLMGSIYLLLNSFSHFRIRFTIPVLDKFFLFPKDHYRHHNERSGPYGVSLSIFDTIFRTRK